MIPKIKIRRSAVTPFVVSLVLTGAAFGQHQLTNGEFSMDPDSLAAMDLVSRRNREAIHPGDPLKVIGMGQGDNNFREGLHAAARGGYVPAILDEKEIYERQLAMYGGSQSYSSALNVQDSHYAADQRKAYAVQDLGDAPAKKPYNTTWIGLLLMAVASVGAFLARGRGTPAA